MRDAVVLLGFRAVRSASLASCVMETMSGTNILDYRDFWHFSVTVGMLAEVSAFSTRSHQHEALTAGVMHNVGRLALDQQLPDGLRRSIEYAAEHEVALPEGERAVLGFTDTELGGALVLHWNFPEALVDSVTNHAQAPQAIADKESLTAHVARARTLAQSFGLPDGLSRGGRAEPPPEWTAPPLSVALRRIGEMDGLLDRVAAFLSSVRPGSPQAPTPSQAGSNLDTRTGP